MEVEIKTVEISKPGCYILHFIDSNNNPKFLYFTDRVHKYWERQLQQSFNPRPGMIVQVTQTSLPDFKDPSKFKHFYKILSIKQL